MVFGGTALSNVLERQRSIVGHADVYATRRIDETESVIDKTPTIAYVGQQLDEIPYRVG